MDQAPHKETQQQPAGPPSTRAEGSSLCPQKRWGRPDRAGDGPPLGGLGLRLAMGQGRDKKYGVEGCWGLGGSGTGGTVVGVHCDAKLPPSSEPPGSPSVFLYKYACVSFSCGTCSDQQDMCYHVTIFTKTNCIQHMGSSIAVIKLLQTVMTRSFCKGGLQNG